MYTLGLHIGHDASAVLMKHNKILGAVQEERFSRTKNHTGYPEAAVEYLLELAKITATDIDYISVAGAKIGEEIPKDILMRRFGLPHSKIRYSIMTILAALFNSNFLRKCLYDDQRATGIISDGLRNKGFVNAQIEFHDHHLCHAASAFYASPFDEALIVTQDGKGDRSSGIICLGRGAEIIEIHRQNEIDSLGQIYAAVTEFLGFKPNRHEGKITGLAAYGSKPSGVDSFRDIAQIVDGCVLNRLRIQRRSLFKSGIPPRTIIAMFANHPQHLAYQIRYLSILAWLKKHFSSVSREDLSFAVQNAVEGWATQLINQTCSKLKLEKPVNLCLAGGLFANVKINQRIFEYNENIENLYVQPAMGDGGLSLGAAYLTVLKKSNKDTTLLTMDNAYLGQVFDDDSIEEILNLETDIKFYYSENIEKIIAKMVYKGNVVGRFNGPAEWGPRALGNRSILLRPTDKNSNDYINVRLNRSEFMPFAPSVLDTQAVRYFKNYMSKQVAAEYMTITYDVNSDEINDIAAVVHVDNTARPQIVKKSVNPSYYKILEEYYNLSGIGCIVNTSFNLHEEPIVNSPQDAIRALKLNAIDVLAIGNYVVQRVSKT